MQEKYEDEGRAAFMWFGTLAQLAVKPATYPSFCVCVVREFCSFTEIHSDERCEVNTGKSIYSYTSARCYPIAVYCFSESLVDFRVALNASGGTSWSPST